MAERPLAPNEASPPRYSAPQRSEPAKRLQAALGPDYELGEMLGSGGFAEVYVAWDRRLKREVAVKTIRPELAAAPALLERFRREAEAIARLRHPHIIPIYSVGESNGNAYFTMPRIRGESLAAAILRGERWSFGEVVRILREAASALAEAHRNGIVHRDVKPENIMLDGPDRRVVVMDFGIAKTMDDVASELTGTGILVGTPYYMSPEQAAGDKNIDHLSDQYSLAIVGYRMLTGRLPFEAENTRAVLFQQAAVTVTPVQELRPDVPAALAKVIERALQKDPQLRYRSMDQFSDALAGLASEVAGEFRTGRRAPSMSDRWANVRVEVGGRERRLVATAVVGAIAFAFAYRASESDLLHEFLGARDETSFAMRSYLQDRGAPANASYISDVFVDDRAFQFYQRAVGMDSLRTIARSGTSLLRWNFTSSGLANWWGAYGYGRNLSYWTHAIPDSMRRAAIPTDSARVLGEGELKRQGYDPSRLTLLRRAENERPNRVERTFTWGVPALTVIRGGDTARTELIVIVAGDEVRSFRKFITLTPGYRTGLSSRARTIMYTAALALLLGGAVFALGLAIRRSSRDSLQWIPAVRWGAVPALLYFATFVLPRMLETFGAEKELRISLPNAANLMFGEVSNVAAIVVVFGLVFLVTESLAYEKRPELMFGMTQLSRNKFAIPEMIPAVLIGYAAGFVALTAGYGVVALVRRVLDLPFEGRPFHWFPFTSEWPALGVPFTAITAVGATLVMALWIAYSVHRGWRVWMALAGVAVLWWMFQLGNSGSSELKVAVQSLVFVAMGFLLLRYGALAALMALYVVIGSPLTMDFLWAGGPFTSAGLASVGFLLVPVVLAYLAHQRRPGAGLAKT